MKKLTYYFLIAVAGLQYSCTAVKLVNGDVNEASKKIAKDIAKAYRVSGADFSLSQVTLRGINGQQQTFEQLFSGRVVYISLLGDQQQADEDERGLTDLQKRFQDDPKVAFVNLYVGDERLMPATRTGIPVFGVMRADRQRFGSLMPSKTGYYLIANKGGVISCNHAPRPTDRVLVDYLIYQAGLGQPGYSCTVHLIDGVGDQKYTDADFGSWYGKHFHEAFNGKLSFTISAPGSGDPTVRF